MNFYRALSDIFSKQDELDLTSIDVRKAIFYLAIPLVITNLLQTAYNIADTIWVGQYSTNALAAISFAFPLVFFLISFGIGISIAGSVLVAQRTGSGDEELASLAASQTFVYALLASIILGVVGFFSVEYLLGFFGADKQVLPLATQYMQIISLGLFSLFGFTVFNALSRGSGDAVTPMLLMTVSVVLNIVIDPILIFGFTNNPLFEWVGLSGIQTALYSLTNYTGHGVAGAAYATVFSRTLAFIVGVHIMFNTNRSITVTIANLKPRMSELKQILRIGIPASTSTLSRSISVNLMLLVVGLFPTTVVAGYGVGVRIFSVVFLPAIAVGQAVETLTGQNYGANKKDRINYTNDYTVKRLFGFLTIFGVITYFIAEPIASIFTNDPQVLNVAKTFLLIVAPTFGFTGILRTYAGGIRGFGRTELAAIISITTLGIIRLPVAYYLSKPFGFGPQGIWYSFAISNIIGGILALIVFKYLIKTST